MSDIMNIITNVGFPIACCGALAYYVSENTKAQRQDAKEDKERMYAQLDRFGDTLDKFNLTLEVMNKELQELKHKGE